ncbi:MAG: NAD(P)/FAD-dependent oxidoreductase [Thermodesulfobacteriota bacterium]
MRQYDAIIVGGGIAGLGVTALLAAKGAHVLLLEKEPILGGRSASFPFQGYTVDIGLHAIASISSSGIGRLLEETGAALEVVPIKPSLMHFDLDRKAFLRATSAERFGQKLYQDFKRLAQAVADLSPEQISTFHQASAQSWIMDNFGNPGLLEFFKKITGFSGQPMDKVSAGAFLETLHDAFTSQVTISYPAHGGIQALNDSLKRAILDKGSEIITNIRAQGLILDGDQVKGVRAKIVRPSYFADLEFAAPVVVYTAPLIGLPRFLPAERLPAALAAKMEQIKSADYYYNGIIMGVRAELLEGFGDRYFQWTFDRPGMDWHGITTIPTYVDPGLAPAGHHLIFVDCHAPMPFGRQDLARQRHADLLELCREIWPALDQHLDWLQRLIYPNILPLAQTGLTGPYRPGYYVAGTRGLYLAGDTTYLTGSGIGSATKSALVCVREIEKRTNG